MKRDNVAAEKKHNEDERDLVIVGKVEFLGVELDTSLSVALWEKIQDERNRNGRVYVAVPRVLFEQWKAGLR